MQVERIEATDGPALDALYAWSEQIIVDDWQCAPGARHPRREELHRYAERFNVYIVRDDDGAIGCMACVMQTGQIFWFMTDPDRFETTFDTLRDYVIERHGAIHGWVSNPLMRQRFLTHMGEVDGLNRVGPNEQLRDRIGESWPS